MGEVTSPRSSRVVLARRLLVDRQARREAGLFVVEGPNAVREALGSAGLAELLLTDAAAQRHPELVVQARSAGADVRTVDDAVLRSISDTVTPQGVVGLARLVSVPLDQALAGSPRLVAVLDEVRDPGNAGTVLRAADAAGADAVLLTDTSVDVHNPKAVRASAGSLFHLAVAEGVQTPDALMAVRAAGLTLVACTGAADLSVDDADLRGPVALVLGNEARGLRPDVVAACDLAVRVPLHGRAESLNLAAAAAVCLYAVARAQRSRGGCAS